jgi:hypothetical protein
MTNVTIKETQNPTILKFEFEDFITQNESFQKHRRGKIILLHSNYFTYLCKDNIHIRKLHRIEKYNIVEWDDVKDAVAEQINTL